MARTQLLEDPELRPFLPLLLVAWADGELEPADLAALHLHVERMPWLRPAARLALREWLDPATPPSTSEVRALRDSFTRVTGTMRPERRRDLLALGLSIAGNDVGEDVRRALAELEAEVSGEDGDTPAVDRKSVV